MGDRPELLALDDEDRGGRNAEIRRHLRDVPTVDPSTAAGRRALAGAQLDLIILAWWPRYVDKRVRDIPHLGVLNLHPSLLPLLRGKHYYFWALRDGVPFGTTIHWASETMDAGPIAFQRSIPTDWTDTGGSLYLEARAATLELFDQSWPAIKRLEIPRVVQDESRATFHNGDELEAASVIDLDQTYTARDLLTLLRARTFRPHGGVRFRDGGREFRVMIDIEEIL
jgi:methionyl-tRNA formyltransferase